MDKNNIKPDNKDNVKMTLDDERRIKVMSPSALVIKRFTRNRLAIIGAVIIVVMFLFSFVGGFLMPYGEAEVFTGYEEISRDFAYASYNNDYQVTTKSGENMSAITRGAFISAINAGKDSYESGGSAFGVKSLGNDFYELSEQVVTAQVDTLGNKLTFSSVGGEELPSPDMQSVIKDAIEAGETKFQYDSKDYFLTRKGKKYTISSGQDIAIASKLIFAARESGFKPDYDLMLNFETALNNNVFDFGDGYSYTEDDGAYIISQNGVEKLLASHLSVQPVSTDVIISIAMRAEIQESIAEGKTGFVIDDVEYRITGLDGKYTIKTDMKTQLIKIFESPSSEHWLGTDGNGMDIFTRLMHGGRISLMIGFVVVIIETAIGIVLGGIAGYFGGFIDALIMRIVDIFNCIPAIPLYLILGAVMDGNKVDPQLRIYVLMLIIGILGWPSIARLVRGQILSLREQEFMIATEATGIRASRRIFKHLIPNVVPQLIVIATMSLGGVILLESTLSFIGMGVKYPYASWGSIITSVNDIRVMTNYWFVWIPAGFLILATVLGFNFIGDGLRDAFDPKMKR